MNAASLWNPTAPDPNKLYPSSLRLAQHNAFMGDATPGPVAATTAAGTLTTTTAAIACALAFAAGYLLATKV